MLPSPWHFQSLALVLTAQRMAAHRRLDQHRVYLCAGALRKRVTARVDDIAANHLPSGNQKQF
jgi:hypothetical protein